MLVLLYNIKVFFCFEPKMSQDCQKSSLKIPDFQNGKLASEIRGGMPQFQDFLAPCYRSALDGAPSHLKQRLNGEYLVYMHKIVNNSITYLKMFEVVRFRSQLNFRVYIYISMDFLAFLAI